MKTKMILQTEGEILRNVHIIAFFAGIIAFIMIAILFSFKMKDKPKNIKNYIIGIIFFMIIYAMSRAAELSKMIIAIFIGTLDPLISDILWYSGAILGAVALLILLFVLELYILEKKTKFILSIISALFLILALVFDPTGPSTSLGKIFLYCSSASALSIPIIYYYYGFKTSGDVRKRSLGAGFGFTIAFFGIIVDTGLGNDIFEALFGNFIGGLTTSILFMILIPLGLAIYYKSIQY